MIKMTTDQEQITKGIYEIDPGTLTQAIWYHRFARVIYLMSKEKSWKEAAEMFNIPETTLRRRVDTIEKVFKESGEIIKLKDDKYD